MNLMLKLLALAAVLYLIILLLFPIWKPVSGRQKKKAKEYRKTKKKEEIRQRREEVRLEIIAKYGRFMMTETQRDRVDKMLKTLDSEKIPEEIRLQQILYALFGVLCALLGFLMNPLFGYASILMTILLYVAPMDELGKKVKRKNKNIERDFPAFYSMIYYQYSKTIHIFLADAIKDFLPNANTDMANELNVMLDNIEYGEEYALKQLKKRVPLHYVIKFCDIMETRLKGYDNTVQMLHLKHEIDLFRLHTLEAELEKRVAKNSRLQFVLIVVLGVIITAYFAFQILFAAQLFQ